MKVLIVDSSSAIISRLKELLAELDTIKKIYDATKCKNAMALVKKHKPDIVLLDINLPKNESFDCLSEIKKLHNATVFIALANRGSSEVDAVKFKLKGVEFFFDKYHEFEKIPQAIRQIAKKNKEM